MRRKHLSPIRQTVQSDYAGSRYSNTMTRRLVLGFKTPHTHKRTQTDGIPIFCVETAVLQWERVAGHRVGAESVHNALSRRRTRLQATSTLASAEAVLCTTQRQTSQPHTWLFGIRPGGLAPPTPTLIDLVARRVSGVVVSFPTLNSLTVGFWADISFIRFLNTCSWQYAIWLYLVVPCV